MVKDYSNEALLPIFQNAFSREWCFNLLKILESELEECWRVTDRMNGKNWQTILTELTKKHESKLSQLDKKDFVNFCFINDLKKVAEDYLKSFRATRKDSAIALLKREEGNKKFIDKNYEESLHLYTKSILHAEKNDESLPLAYANRSYALQKMNYLKESLADIELAVACGYPKAKIEKLRLRKAKCIEQMRPEENLKKEYRLPKLAENKDFASAAASLSVQYDEIRGRHVIANKAIKAGELLFVEKAFAFVMCEQGCTHCLKVTLAPIPCETCLDATYCSLKCREDSLNSGHSFLCGFGELFKSVGIGHLGLQIIIAASSCFNELKNKLNRISEPEYKGGPVSYNSVDYDSVYNLVHHQEKYEPNDLIQYAMTALLLATYMKNHTNYFPATSGEEELKLLTSVILRHILQMICNGHAIMGVLIKDENNSMTLSKAEERVTTAIYPSVSMMNHSCLPSVIMSFYKSYIIVHAAKEIKEGEEVYNCYGVDARRMKRSLRQDILTKQYFFNCKCEACIETYDIQDRLTAFKCTICKGPLVQPDESVQEGVCIDCGKVLEISSDLIFKNNKFYSVLEEGNQLLAVNPGLALRKCLQAWKLGFEIFYKFHKDLCYAADTVAKCFAELGEFQKSASFLKRCIVSVEERFGFLSFELIEELNKLLDVQKAYIVSSRVVPREALAYFQEVHQKCMKIIRILDADHYFRAGNLNSLEEFLEAYS